MIRVAIHSAPRSGSTWLGCILDSVPEVAYKYQPLFSYAFKNYLTVDSTQEDIINFFEQIEESKDEFINQFEKKEKAVIPIFTKSENITHIVYKEVRYHNILQNLLEKDPHIKVIGLVRNPLSVINSWLRAPKEFRSDLGWNIQAEWLNAPKKNKGLHEEYNGFEKWKEIAYLFEDLQKKYMNRFYLLTYDELLNNTKLSISKLFDFVDLKLNDQTISFLNQSKNIAGTDAYGVFRIKDNDNDWQQYLPTNIVEYIQKDLSNTQLAKYL